MTILVVGASGATGRLLVQQLLDQGHTVRAIVRSLDSLPENLRDHSNLSVMCASISDLGDEEMAEAIRGCSAVASCLGHNMTLKGFWGRPRRLVTDATRRLCEAIIESKPAVPVRFVLMNTSGNRNRDLNEEISFGEKCIIALIRLLLPPHADNEEASDYLRTRLGQEHPTVEWTVIRPDGLVNEEQVSGYEVFPSPTRSAIFGSGKTSRINVGQFMADLATVDSTWQEWKGQMPVIYNKAQSKI